MEISTLPVLRPLRLGELLDQAFRIYRRNFLTFVGIMAIVYIPYVALQTILSTFFLTTAQNMNSQEMITSPAYWLFILGSFTGAILEFVFVRGLGTAALTNAAARSHLNQKINILDSFRQLGISWFHLLLAIFSLSVIMFIMLFFAVLPIIGWFTGIGIIVFLSAIDDLLPAIAVVEKSTWFDPVTRAWNMARRRFWWLIGVSIIFTLFTILISTGPSLLISSLSSSIGKFVGNGASLVVTTLISTILASLLQLITHPIFIIAKTLVYFDLRVRTEGFDLALAAIEIPEGKEIDISRMPIPPSNQQWLTWDDISKFVIITLVMLGVIALGAGITAIFLTIAKSFAG